MGIYARSHGLPISADALSCELCGRTQHWSGPNHDWALVRLRMKNPNLSVKVRRVSYNLEAICKYCYSQSLYPRNTWRLMNLNKGVDTSRQAVIH